MQLPRGKFRSVIKGVSLNSLIQELAEVRYTGNISISWKREVISLVIQKGRYVLAEFGPLRGNGAWEGTLALGEATIDAYLSDFSEPELKLALEFNELCILSSQAVPGAPRKASEKVHEPPPPGAAPEAAGETALPVKTAEPPSLPLPPTGPGIPPGTEGAASRESTTVVVAPGAPQTWTKADMAQAIAMVSEKDAGEVPPAGEYDELALLHMEMATLDDVDVEHIATKIRKNARGIVKKLHLGHLMTEKEE